MGLMKMEMGMLLFVMTICGFCNGSVYKVGDSAGWGIIGNVDYNKWASSKSFQIGDTIIFEYNPLYHNVVQVSRMDFHVCDTTAPIATYATGNDSIAIRSPGHYYYICGFVGHCQAGQKVDIRATHSGRPALIPIPSPIQDSSHFGPVAPSPSLSNGQSLMDYNGLISASAGFCLFLFGLFFDGFL